VGLAAARGLALAWGADLVGYPTLALVAAMARSDTAGETVAVAMTGGHGEWFTATYAADGRPLRELASLTPSAAVAATGETFVAGTQAEALVAARGHGRALPLWPDARRIMLLGAESFTSDTAPIYGRAPDAKIAGARQ
jgi:tRNA threonylcarbamoyladenosine biosynthesis protein TsaB